MVNAATLVAGHIAAANAAANGVADWAASGSPTNVFKTVQTTLAEEGFPTNHVTVATTRQGHLARVTVAFPMMLWGTKSSSTVVKTTQTALLLPAVSSTDTHSVEGGVTAGGTTIVLHHFPMWW
jgi:hypothetical protein